MAANVVIKGVSCVLTHVPSLVPHGSKPRRELANGGEELRAAIQSHTRDYAAAAAYGPNQAFIGNIHPRELFDRPRPWWADLARRGPRNGPFGEVMPEDEFWGMLKIADEFELLHLEREAVERAVAGLRSHTLITDADLGKIGAGGSATDVAAKAADGDNLPLVSGAGRLVGVVLPGYEGDASQTADILLENLAAKASGALALRHLLRQTGSPPASIDYVLGCGEEAVGDRYQRGGGNLAKAIAEMAGLPNATGSDVKAFCCAPVHASVIGGSLIAAGVNEHVVIVGGGSLAKLGMKFLGALSHEMPILEDCLAAIAIELGRDDGRGDPCLRLDVVGKHDVSIGSAPKALYEALVLRPLAAVGLTIPDVDRYAVELHNSEIMESGGSGNVSRNNYRIIGALAAMAGQPTSGGVEGFERSHGVPGYVPTQGHVPAALPYLAHARAEMRAGSIQRAMFVAKGSLFLGKMTTQADGMSFLVEANALGRAAGTSRQRHC